ncbi:GNAT family N-acetyltransferase [Kitasatospora atroaurantiaca]|uniref:Ribosomal protein S18 acetylase RimI-like enzyme n=1 Tax=Kitasatospora atroaurantiaca TaxID=285545 RepID=A0A561EIK2_9ACTN|nr:GNAT family N-acetyltransferase [Kitasatospora atroaurantiaca]TWE15402.1 ribosomal protein S18 acetylase RimI-like enzyme [Kitasatospora atroaurantiaca]
MPNLAPQQLPAGYRNRSATTVDAQEIHRLVAACERELHGRVDTDPGAIVADLAMPGLDLAVDTLLVHDSAGELVARAWVKGGRRAEIDVHPGHRGRGLGRWLLDWAELRACQSGSERLAQTVSDEDRAAIDLLRSHGYGPFVTQWLLAIAMPTEPTVPEPPAGITVRPFRPGDERAAYRLTEDAFDEWQKRRKSYDEWARHTVERATFAPAASPAAFAGDHMVGAVLSVRTPGTDEGYIERVAVRHDHRNRGIAGTLLQYAYRSFHQQGQRTCTLWTHSETGALPFYERLGMTVRRSSTVYGKPLTGR